MTYCLGIKVRGGIVGIADTRITSGHETTQAPKIFTVNKPKHSFFIMTSGLRSVRDKALTYFNEIVEEEGDAFNKLYKVVNAFSSEVKRVSREDKSSLKESGLHFNLHAIIGGQLEDDAEQKIYLLYPEGNWIEIQEGTPYVIIGNNGYGKPILDRAVSFDSSMQFALKAGFLSFDATRISANDVDYPIDVVHSPANSHFITKKRFTKTDLEFISEGWNSMLRDSIDGLPGEWLERLNEKPLPENIISKTRATAK